MDDGGGGGKWLQKDIHGFLFDIYGVLYEMQGTQDVLINGSVEAIRKLREADIAFRFCTNTSTRTAESMVERLRGLGFDARPHELFTPIPALFQYLEVNGLRPFAIVDPGIKNEFLKFDDSNPNCVVLGDAQDEYSYQRLNKAFQILMQNKDAKLITLGTGLYYKEVDVLKLDCGTFAKALEFACDVKPIVIGKPSKEFFLAPLVSMSITPENAVMVGDDLFLDIEGGQSADLRSVLVRTGRYRREDESHPRIKPDGCVDNLLDLVNIYLRQKRK